MLRCMGCMAEIPEGAQFCPVCGYAAGTPAREAYHLPPGTILQGRYIAGRVLGYGGFGVTYIGYDAALERIVAIKEFLPSTFATRIPGDTAVTVYEGNATEQFGAGLSRFVEEAQTLAQFNGIPGIVDIYDSFMGNNTAYIVMQFLKGRDVKERLTSGGPMPYEEAREIILSICDTLAPVHARGIIHRDISPDNIYRTESGEIKLLDFGAARYESAMNSKSLSVILKSGYAPEEQYRSRGEQGPWTDVYALAATFYKMLTGQTPPDSMERAIQDELQEPSKLGAVLPESAENAILNALCVRKGDRTKTVTDFKNALLSDGVERVKVKKTGGGAARVPTGAKVAIAASVGVLVLLGLFTAVGGFGEGGLIGGTKLEDTYGSASKEGYVAVPSLAGKNREEAKQLLEELGLVLEVKDYQFTKAVQESPLVTKQSPTAGSQIEEGGTVGVTLNAGDFLAAMENGLVPQMVGMPENEAYGLVENCDFRDAYPSFVPAYSGEEMLGRVTEIRYTEEDDYARYEILVGCGPDNGPAYIGALRTACLDEQAIVYSIASPGYYTGDDNPEELRLRTSVLASADGGASWVGLTDDTTYDGYYVDENNQNKPHRGWAEFGRVLMSQHPELAGKELRLRLERRRQLSDELVDTLDLAQAYRFDFVGEALRVDAVEALTETEATALYEEGAFDPNDGNVKRYFEPENEEERLNNKDSYVFLRIQGNFSTNNYYEIEVNGSRETGTSCETPGVLLAMVYRRYNDGEGAVLRILPNRRDRVVDRATGSVSVTLAQPASTTSIPAELWQEP